MGQRFIFNCFSSFVSPIPASQGLFFQARMFFFVPICSSKWTRYAQRPGLRISKTCNCLSCSPDVLPRIHYSCASPPEPMDWPRLAVRHVLTQRLDGQDGRGKNAIGFVFTWPTEDRIHLRRVTPLGSCPKCHHSPSGAVCRAKNSKKKIQKSLNVKGIKKP